jgi:predicted nucleic acid-binding protein
LAYLIDTNLLARLAVPEDPRNSVSRHAVETLDEAGLFACSQNFVEFWNVATRPAKNNGLGLSIAIADRVMRRFELAFSRVPEPPETYDHWRDLIVRFGISGSKVHDARLVAIMLTNDISQILTFNVSDFRRYEMLGIRAVDPGQV